MNSKSLLGNLSSEQFLRNYWQKKPLLIRNAWPNLKTPITAEELAGLACEETVHARLVQEKHPQKPWHVSYSPFQEKDFLTLPESHWTLLVTDCEKHLPELRTLIEPFRFIPDWRIDDLMISYAADKGSVGPHIDQYDVFLLQLEGIRHWEISEQPLNNPQCIEDLDLAILKNFEPAQSWEINPGDLLYLPPGIPHHGVAKGPCLTASIGFRAPSQADLLHDYTDFITAQLNDNDRYNDPDLKLQNNPAEITPQAIHEFRQMIQSGLEADENAFSHWLGRMLTAVTEETEKTNLSKDLFLEKLQSNQSLCRSSFARLAFIEQKNQVILFVNGKNFPFDLSLLENIQVLGEKYCFIHTDFQVNHTREWNEFLFELFQLQVIEFDE